MRQPTLSIILPTYNRVALLRRAVAALLRQTAPSGSYEIVVVDNNCSDGTAELLSRGSATRGVRVIHEPRQGLSHARNAGLEAARAPIVAFTDDDVEAAPDVGGDDRLPHSTRTRRWTASAGACCRPGSGSGRPG